MRRAADTTLTARCTAGITAAAVLVTQLVLPPHADASHLGSSTASAGSAPPPAVSAVQSFQPDLFTGRATTAIPIAVPPGRKGMQPNLALTYSSSGRNGWLGMGWMLDAGYIERSTRNGVPRYDSSDAYTFMFQGVASDLVKIPDGTYRAKDEGLFLRFENKGVSGWEVRDKSGFRYFFGQTAASQIESSGSVFRWALDKVIDPNGNSLTISYTKDQGQLYLAQIRYTGHEPTALTPANQVDFILESRPDIETSYRSGFALTTAKRLKTIETKATVNGVLSLARRYQLAYTTSVRTSRSLLSSVQQFGTDGATGLPATAFTYQDTGTASYPSLLNNFQPPPSQAAWNVRKASQDTGHENFGCVHPYQGLPWGSPSVAGGGFSQPCLSGSVSGTGDVSMSGCQDTFGHAWTYIYVGTPKTISVSLTNGSDADSCVYREDASGVTRITGGSISLQAGWSILHVTAYHQHQGWGPTTLGGGIKSQVDVMNPSQITLGVPQLAGDVNGDAKTDIIKFTPSSGSWSVSCATSCSLSPGGAWISGFGNSSSTPLLGDWNGDGRTDIAIYNSGSWQFATSTGTSFQTGTVSSLSFGSGTPITGDFNGDGTIDLGTYNNGSWSVALGTGSGFASTGSFSLSWGDSNYEALTGDFNGDGLTDIGLVNKSTGAIAARLSTGSGWTAATTWIGSFGGSQPHTSADFNGDGLTDAVYYNRPTGQVIYAPSTGGGFSAPVTLPLTFSLTSSDDTIQVGDFNGDGIADPAVFNLLSGSSQLALSSLTNPDGSNGTATDALRTVANGLGGVTTLTYQPSSLCGCTPGEGIPFALHVVQKAVTTDGLGNSYPTTYLFHGGLYDGPTKEFRGFEEATVFDADGNKTITRFHQDAHKRGRPFRTEFKDQYDKLWTKTEQTWSCSDPFPGVHFTKLDQTDGFTYDGDATFKQARSRFTYDQFGNVTRTDEDGDVGVVGDERATATTYVLNETGWILNKPALTQTLTAAGTVVAQRRFYYDGATLTTTPPTLGNLTKEEEWRNLPTEQWLATALTYDAFGNVATVTDALNRTTANTYDAIGTYLTQIANVLGHTRQLAYDARLGAVTSSTDQNNVATTTEYDALGRVAKLIGPNDTSTLPTIRYDYDVSTVPSKTTACARVQSGQSAELCTLSFMDGLGRTVQTRAPAEDSTKHVVTGAVEFNPRGLAVKQWVPYLDIASTTYRSHTQVTGLANPVTYTYDPLGRLRTITDPDGSVSSTSYSDWVVTATDARGNQTRHTHDAYGRLVKVEELNGTQTYTTTYAYDTLNNLTRVTDHAQNVTTITYDSLSRKRSMDDPDTGHWEYAYDGVDNLLMQTDARSVVTTFQYDALNRQTQKSYTIPSGSGIINPGTVTYAYDGPAQPFSKGKLTQVVDAASSVALTYDNLGRITTKTKTIGGTPRTISRTYDLLGRVLTLTYPNGAVATSAYNTQGGLETVTLQPQGQPVKSIVANMDYNAASQITKIVYGNGVVSDNTFHPQTLRLDRLLSTGPTGTLQDFRYTVDAVGNVTQIQDLVRTGSQSFQYDALNRLTQASGSYGNHAYAYDPIGNMTLKEGVTMTYGAGPAGPHAVTSTSDGWTMTYDANGNVLQKTPASSSMVAQNMRYDVENRLTEVKTAQEVTVTLQFKPGHNFFSLPVIPTNSQISALFPTFSQDLEWIGHFNADYNHPNIGDFQFYVNHPKFDDFTALEYGKGYQLYCKNPNGFTVQITGKLPTTPYSLNLLPEWHLLPAIAVDGPQPVSWLLQGVNYDQVKRWNPTTQQLETPAQILPGESYFVHVVSTSLFNPPPPRDQTTTFVYDGDGGKVKQVTATGTTVYLGDQVEIAPDGTTTNYVLAGPLRVAAMDSTGALRFYHQDHLGSSNVVTDSTGALVEVNEHTPYGSLSRHEGPADVRHKFTGQHQDSGTGLILFPARAYDPKLGRFLQPDPFVQDPSDPQSLNRYAYARNNPVNLIDPSGYGWIRWVARIVGAIVGAVVGFFTCGPECAVTGAIIGFSIGDSIGAAVEGRSNDPNAQGVSFPIGTSTFSDEPVAGPGTQAASATLTITGSGLEGIGEVDGLDQITAALTESLGLSDQAAAHVAGEFVPEAGPGLFLDLLLFGGGLLGLALTGSPASSAGAVARGATGLARRGAIVIGENMTRVRRAGRALGAKVFRGETRAGNTRFINRAKKAGDTIYDIGPDFARRAKRLRRGKPPEGPGYNLERQLTVGYDKLRRLWRRTGKHSGESPF